MFKRRSRFLAVLGAVSFVAAAGAPTALADVGLGGAGSIVQTAASSPVTLSQAARTPSLGDLAGAVVPATRTATQTATQETVAEPAKAATRTVAPAVQTVQNVTDEPLRAASQVVAPVAEDVTTTAQPVIAATQAVEPVVNLVEPVLQPRPRPLDDVLGTVTSRVEQGRPGSGGASAPAETGSTPTSATTNGTTAGPSSSPHAATPATRVSRPTSKRLANPPDAQLPGFRTLPSASVGDPPVTATGNVAATSQPTAPLPGLPGGPPTALFTASASGGAGALVIMLAALATAVHLAVPGLGRRLRPGLAPWPQPMPHLSLERPG